MAIYYARANGNVNATNVWSTTQAGATSDLFPSFTNADTLMANGFTVTINVNTTVLEIRTDTTGGATAGGSFTLNNSITLTSNVYGGSSNLCLTYPGNSPNSASIVGNIVGGTASSQAGALRTSGTGTLNITGNIIGASGASGMGLETISAAGTTNIVGNVTGGSAGGSHGIGLNVAGSICNITGNVTGGSNSTAYGVNFGAAATLSLTGVSVGGTIGNGINNTLSSTITITRAKGNGFGNGSVGLAATVGLNNTSSSATARTYEIEYGDLGQSPTSGPVFLFPASSNVALFYRSGTSKKTLVDASSSSGLLPNASDVRNGITYNAGTNIGTMAVPAAASVALGVAVDNTTGTAVLTTDNIGDIWNYPVSGISVSNSIGERLKNCSTVASMGQQLAAALNNVQ